MMTTPTSRSPQSQVLCYNKQHKLYDGFWHPHLTIKVLHWLNTTHSVTVVRSTCGGYWLRSQPFPLSLSTTSDTSNIFMGRGIFLLAAMVFRRPGRSVVRATCKGMSIRVNVCMWGKWRGGGGGGGGGWRRVENGNSLNCT